MFARRAVKPVVHLGIQPSSCRDDSGQRHLVRRRRIARVAGDRRIERGFESRSSRVIGSCTGRERKNAVRAAERVQQEICRRDIAGDEGRGTKVRDRHRPGCEMRARNRRGVEEIGLGVCESAISPFQAAVDSRENRCDREHLERTTHREVSRANTHGSAFANRKNTARRCGDDMLVRRSGYDLKVFQQWS